MAVGTTVLALESVKEVEWATVSITVSNQSVTVLSLQAILIELLVVATSVTTVIPGDAIQMTVTYTSDLRYDDQTGYVHAIALLV